MKLIYSLAILLFLSFFYEGNLKADTYFLDFKSISIIVGRKKANEVLNNQLNQGLKKLIEREKQLQDEEKNRSTKKILSPEDYKKNIKSLRNKVSKLQKDRNSILESVSKKEIMQEINY